MKMIINDGQDIIKIVSDGFVSCLIVKKALAAIWPDCEGSVGEYYSIAEYASEERQCLTNTLDNVLINGDEEQIFKTISSFLNLFSNGEYEINITQLDLKTSSFFYEDQLIYSESVPENQKFSGQFYPFNWTYLFTIPNKNLNPERIEFYYNLIKNGGRPKIIVFGSYNINTSQYNTSGYILDGHHKLKAYLKLGIDIPAVSIMKLENEKNKKEEVLQYIKPLLKDFEYAHIIKNNN